MDIEDYLGSTRLVHKISLEGEPEWFVDYLLSCAKKISERDVCFHQVSSSAVSHQAVKLGSKWFIVWDNVLAQTLNALLYGFGNFLQADEMVTEQEKANATTYGSSVCRRTLAAYFANKLVDRPYVSAAFAMIALEDIQGADSLDEGVRAFLGEVSTHQKMMMFFHELTHIVFDDKPELHAQCMSTISGSLEQMGELRRAGKLWPDATPADLKNSRELDSDFALSINSHFIDELACDYQALFIAFKEDWNRDGPKMDWTTRLSIIVFASQLLGRIEGDLNISVRSLVNICEGTNDFTSTDKDIDRIGIQARMREERPRFLIRRWNTQFCLLHILESVSKAMHFDATTHMKEIQERFLQQHTLWDESGRRQLDSFFMPEGLSAIFARVRFLREHHKLSESQALAYSASLLRWGDVSFD